MTQRMLKCDQWYFVYEDIPGGIVLQHLTVHDATAFENPVTFYLENIWSCVLRDDRSLSSINYNQNKRMSKWAWCE